jgi:hypothetical protein
VVILFSRVITRLGEVETINPRVVEDLFSADLSFLEDFYQRINAHGHSTVAVTCPHCEGRFDVEVSGVGE